jgi:hypothetical protein
MDGKWMVGWERNQLGVKGVDWLGAGSSGWDRDRRGGKVSAR